LIVLRKYSSVLQTTGFNNILLAENQYQCSLTTSLNERNIGARPEKAPDYTLKKGGKASLKSITMVFRTATDTEMADIIMRKPCGRFVLQMVCSLCKRKIEVLMVKQPADIQPHLYVTNWGFAQHLFCSSPSADTKNHIIG